MAPKHHQTKHRLPFPPLVVVQTQEFKHQRDVFDSKARAWTRQHAMQQVVGPSTATEATPDKAPFAEAEHSGQLDRQQDQEAGTVLQTQLRGAEEEGPKERGDVLGSANGGTLPDAGWKRGREAHGEDKEDRPPGMSVSAPAAHGAQEGALQAPCEQPKRSKLSLRR